MSLPEPTKVRLARAVMEAHYREPVRPVSHYCNAFRDWAKALQAKAAREDAGTEHNATPDHRDESLRKIVEALPQLQMQIAKSSMLGRLIYEGETLRTEMCPKHKGRWAGLAFSATDCLHGCDLTGWLPNGK